MQPSEMLEAEFRANFLEAERQVNLIANQPKSLSVLREAIETVASIYKAVTLSITDSPPMLRVERESREYGHRITSTFGIEIKDDAIHVHYIDVVDMGTKVFHTLQQVAWYVRAGIYKVSAEHPVKKSP